jgi:hypothetical protein
VPRGKNYSEMQPLDFIWTPNLKPLPGDMIADHVFRSPALMLQKDSLFVALIPDLQHLIRHRAMPAALDFQLPRLNYDDSIGHAPDSLAEADSSQALLKRIAALEARHAAPLLSFGFWPWKTRDHVYYQPDSTRAPVLQDTEVSYAYYLWLDHRAAPFLKAASAKNKGASVYAFRHVVDFFWEKFSPLYRRDNIGALPGTLDQMAQRAWKQYAEQTWFETTLNGRPVGGIKSNRLAWSNQLPADANNDVWFNSWFQTLRTAHGMYLYGKRNREREASLMERAEKVLNLTLSAPNDDGIFPSIYYFAARPAEKSETPINAAVVSLPEKKAVEPEMHHWIGDEGWAGFGNDYNHTFDASSVAATPPGNFHLLPQVCRLPHKMAAAERRDSELVSSRRQSAARRVFERKCRDRRLRAFSRRALQPRQRTALSRCCHQSDGLRDARHSSGQQMARLRDFSFVFAQAV